MSSKHKSLKDSDIKIYHQISAKKSRAWRLVTADIESDKIKNISGVGNFVEFNHLSSMCHLEEAFPFLVGMDVSLTSIEAPIYLPSMLLAEGFYADVYLFKNESGECCVLLEDISEHAVAVFEQQQSKNSLKLLVSDLNKDIEIEKLKFKDINFMIGHLGHEIKNPIIAALNVMNGLSKDNIISSPDKAEEQIYFAKKALNLALSIAKDTVDYAGLLANKKMLNTSSFRWSDLEECLKNIFAPMAKTKNLEFKIESQIASDAMFEGDEVRLTQVLINLISNAIKYTEQGHVSMVVEKIGSASDRLRISVHDTGEGLKGQDLSNLIKKFTRGHNVKTEIGSGGLGLAISASLLEQMDAKIEYKRLDNTSIFYFDISLQPQLASESIGLDQAVDKMESLNIALIDDQQFHRFIFKNFLEQHKFEVSMFESAKDFITALVDGKNFDVVLIDFNLDLSERNGVEVVKYLRGLSIPSASIPAILMSSDEIDLSKWSAVEKIMFLNKKITPQGLNDKIRSFLKKV